MSNQSYLCLLLSVSLAIVLSGSANAQSKQSHHELPGELDMRDAQEMMVERLRDLQELHRLQDQARKLLDNSNFVNQIKGQFSEEELQRLQERFLRGDSPGGDGTWDKLLQHVASGKELDDQQIEDLRRWVKESVKKQTPPPNDPNSRNDSVPSPTPDHSSGPGHSNPSTSPPSMQPPERSLMDRMQVESEKWLSQHLEGMSDDVARALADMRAEDGSPLADLLRALKQADLPTEGLVEPATGLSRYLPNMENFLNDQRDNWDGMRSLFREVSMPSLPGFDRGRAAISIPSTEPSDGRSPAAVFVTLLTLGVFLLLVWKMGGWPRPANDPGEWRLGPWPVSPGAVATRQDLVRAFEYLALLRLGPQASTCHHRELAGRLAEQDADNPTRRQSVEQLAFLYEQARYAPAGEALSQEELSDARHALCYLAGVTAA